MPCPTHALQNSPSWKKLTAKQRMKKAKIEDCLLEVSTMAEIEELKEQLDLKKEELADIRERILD